MTTDKKVTDLTKEVDSRTLSVLEQDERDTSRMVSTLRQVRLRLEREGKLPKR